MAGIEMTPDDFSETTGLKKNDQLVAAIQRGDLNAIKTLIGISTDMEQDGHQCLINACRQDDNKLVSYLVRTGVDINRTDEDGLTALHLCVIDRRPKCARLLVDNGALLDMRYRGMTPLLTACHTGYGSMAIYLAGLPSCTRPARVEAMEFMGAMCVKEGIPQHAHSNWLSSVEARLKDAPGDLHPKSQLTHPVYGHEFNTAQDLDRVFSSLEEMWLQALIVMERILGHFNTSVYDSFAFDACAYFETIDDQRCISIAMYIIDRRLQLNGNLIQSLSSPLCDLNNIIISLISKDTPLPYEVMMPVLTKGVEITELAMRTPVADGLQSKPPSLEDIILLVLYSIAFLAKRRPQISQMNQSNFKQLISKFVKLNPRIQRNMSPLHMVTIHLDGQISPIDIVELLLEAGSDPAATDCNGQTPMHYVCKEQLPLSFPIFEVVQLLIQAGANPQAIGRYGNIPLHIMAMNNRPDQLKIIRLLLSHCCSCPFNTYNVNGELFTKYLPRKLRRKIKNPSSVCPHLSNTKSDLNPFCRLIHRT